MMMLTCSATNWTTKTRRRTMRKSTSARPWKRSYTAISMRAAGEVRQQREPARHGKLRLARLNLHEQLKCSR